MVNDADTDSLAATDMNLQISGTGSNDDDVYQVSTTGLIDP